MANQYTNGSVGGYLTALYTAKSAPKARKKQPGHKRLRHAFRRDEFTRYRDARREGRRRIAPADAGAFMELYLLDAKGRPHLLEQHVVREYQGTRAPYRRVVQEER